MLSAVYIKGFKTFARPVRMPLEAGVTAVVGPNGSGKSNITDAVLFALGEQSPGLLRAGAMGDLIFSGSESLAAANAAEVTLVLDNETGRVSLPYKEVSISRRITRGGETEYSINGSRSRLVDVRAVAGEAGLGRHSILRQGAVDAIVAGGAAACRLALEEAAGLGVYRRRRLSASRRLERADTQLEKIRQLEAEISEQLRKIEREAVAARQYRELESRFRKLSLAHLYRVATQGLDERRRKLEEAKEQVSELSDREAALRGEDARLEPELKRMEEHVRRVERHLERLEDLSEEVQSEYLRADRALLRLESSRDGEAERARSVSRLRAELDKVSAALEELEGERNGLDMERDERQRELRGLQEEVEEARSRRAAAEKERARLVGHLERIRARRDRSVASEDVIGEDELAEVSRCVGELERIAKAGPNTGDESLRGRIGECRDRAAALDSQLQRRRGNLDSAVGRTESRIRSLQVLETNGNAAPRLEEVIRARPGYEAAVEAAIGESGRGVLARNLEESMKLLSDTERIALRLDAERVEENENPPGKPLLECVEVMEGRYTEAVERLLAGIYVVDNLENNAPGNGYVAVTRDGLRLTRTSVSLRHGEGRFVREVQLAEEIRRLENLKDGPGAILYDLQEAVSAAASRLGRLETVAGAVTPLISRVSSASALVVREAIRRRDRASSARKRHLQHAQDRVGLEEEIAATEKSLRDAEASASSAERDLQDVSASLESGMERVRELEGRKDRLDEGLRNGERRRAEISEYLQKMEETSETDAERAIRISKRLADVSRQLGERLRERRAGLRQHRTELTENHRSASEERANISRKAVDLAGELATARAAAAKLGEDLERAENASRAAAEEIREEWGATLETAREEAEEFPAETEKERNALARKLKRFGDVNLLALSQEEGLRERHEFVAAQRADAEAASNELDRIIREIDREIEDRFTQTFEQVKTAFADIMPRMMHGASGRLELSEEGVEVGLRLGRRGWKPLNVLSGGERSLLALAFLFSIFLSRPGDSDVTFCMLDEAEAALDDVNLARFLSVVDSYRAGGQFILVTHQKRTMAAADVLYGVIQDASGATTVVSKRLSGE